MKVGLVGRSDHDNFGDSLMFAYYVKEANLKGIEIFVVEATEIFMQRLLESGLRCESLPLSDVSCLDYCLFIGGGYFGQPDLRWYSWNRRFLRDSYFKKVKDRLVEMKIPYDIFGVEVGPLYFSDTRIMVKDILSDAENVVVRNKASEAYVRDVLGITCQFRRDVVLGQTPRYYSVVEKLPNSLIVHATGKFLKGNALSAQLRKKIKSFIVSANIEKVCILFDQTTYAKLLPAAESFSEELGANGVEVEVVFYQGMDLSLSIIARHEKIITSKLHAGVTSLSLGGQVLCISGAPKIKRFYSEVFLGRGLFSLIGAMNPWKRFEESDFVSLSTVTLNDEISSRQYLDDFVGRFS